MLTQTLSPQGEATLTCATCPFAAKNEDGTIRDLGRQRCVCTRDDRVTRTHHEATQECHWAIEELDHDHIPEGGEMVDDHVVAHNKKVQPTYEAVVDALTYSSFVATVQAYERQGRAIPSVESLSLLYGDDAERYLSTYQHEQAQSELNNFLEAQADEIAPEPTVPVEEDYIIEPFGTGYLMRNARRQQIGTFSCSVFGWGVECSPRAKQYFENPQDAQRYLIANEKRSQRAAELERAAVLAPFAA